MVFTCKKGENEEIVLLQRKHGENEKVVLLPKATGL